MVTLTHSRVTSCTSQLIIDLQTDQDSSIVGPLTVLLARHDDVTKGLLCIILMSKIFKRLAR
jgi:hypothetical protein